jgi:hypothetical protein
LNHQLEHAYQLLAQRLTALGLPARTCTFRDFTGYTPVTGLEADVHHLEAYLGPAPRKPGYDSHAIVHGVDPRYPSLAHVFLAELHHETREPSPTPPTYSRAIDPRFDGIFLATMTSALNHLDPTGGARGMLVQAYNAAMTLGNLVTAFASTWTLLMRFKRDGQLALIAVDYADPLTKAVATACAPVMRALGDIHVVPRTEQPSAVHIPFRGADGGTYLRAHASTALDEGFRIARRYLDAHYRRSGYAPPEHLAR